MATDNGLIPSWLGATIESNQSPRYPLSTCSVRPSARKAVPSAIARCADQASRWRRKNTAGIRKLLIGIDSDRTHMTGPPDPVPMSGSRSRIVRNPTTIAPSVNRIVGTGRPVTVSGRCGGRGSCHGVPSMVAPVGSSGTGSAMPSVIDRALPPR